MLIRAVIRPLIGRDAVKGTRVTTKYWTFKAMINNSTFQAKAEGLTQEAICKRFSWTEG